MDTITDRSIEDVLAEAQGFLDKNFWAFARVSLTELYARGHRPAFIAQQLGDVCGNLGDLTEAIDWHRKAIAHQPRLYQAHEHLIFNLDAQASTTEAEAKHARRMWWDTFGRDAYLKRMPHDNVRDPEKRLRVGYLSGDFNFHSAAIAWTGVVTQHNGAVIEPVLYSTLETWRHDNRTQLWKNDFGDHFVDVSTIESAHELALTIQRDQVDILVDLSGYTNNNRLLAFAFRPAPIQIQAWGYVLGTQSPMFDALFVDETLAPPSVQKHLTERAVYLPSVLTYHPPTKANGAPSDLPLPPETPSLSGPPVFAVYQRAMKCSDDFLDACRQILARVQDAKIYFKGADYSPTWRTRIARAVSPYQGRITFDFNTDHHDHMQWYHLADLSLDPWPQTGGVSTLESLYMGVPVITLIGPRMIQRASASFLTRVGLTECIAHTTEEYVNRACEFVTTRRRELDGIRQGLRATLETSPIMVGYVDAVEAAYRKLWREYCIS